VAAYANDLRDFQKWLDICGCRKISDIELKNYLATMVIERRLAAATVRRRFACVRSFFRRLSELEGAEDPFVGWFPKLPRRKQLPRSLTRAEVALLLSSFGKNTPREPALLPLIVRLLVVTGMRVGELCKMRVDDVAHDGSIIRISGKGSRDRVAYITDAALKRDLLHHLEFRRRTHGSTDWLFLNRHGNGIRAQSVRSTLSRYATEAGLARHVTPHMLRHTAATLLIETGVDIRYVQRLLGHSTIATTEIYTHVSDEALRATIARADILGALAN
jgi:integrase/recombinase XerD